jgi:hypothetical protein
LEERNRGYSRLDQNSREKGLYRWSVQFLENAGNRVESFAGKEPDSPNSTAIHAFEKNVDVTMRRANRSNKFFVRAELVRERAFGFVTELVQSRRQTAIQDNGQLACQYLRTRATERSI